MLSDLPVGPGAGACHFCFYDTNSRGYLSEFQHDIHRQRDDGDREEAGDDQGQLPEDMVCNRR
eukprot:COSAG02_NODE_56698_length_284_cov_0.832432_1_plen_62_part_01